MLIAHSKIGFWVQCVLYSLFLQRKLKMTLVDTKYSSGHLDINLTSNISLGLIKVVMNLVTTHYNCTSPMDYISHHALHTHIPVHHYTNHTAVTIHSLVLIASPHLHLILTLTFKQHSHLHSLRSLVSPWLHFRAFFPVCLSVHYLDC